MKKIKLLMPALLTPTLLASTSLSSCSYADYQVTEEEFRQIISLEGVKLMQTVEEAYDGSVLAKKTSIEFSDNVSHKIKVEGQGQGADQTYYEVYVRKNTDRTYTKWERDSLADEFSDPTTAISEEFDSILERGENFTYIYDQIIEWGFSFSFDTNKKCYFYHGVDIEEFTIEFYFFKKQLISFKQYYNNKLNTDVSFTYNQITPVPPTC